MTDLISSRYPFLAWCVMHEPTHSRCELWAKTRTEAMISGAEILGCPLMETRVIKLEEW